MKTIRNRCVCVPIMPTKEEFIGRICKQIEGKSMQKIAEKIYQLMLQNESLEIALIAMKMKIRELAEERLLITEPNLSQDTES